MMSDEPAGLNTVKLRKQISHELRLTAMNLLARREHSFQELQSKLREKQAGILGRAIPQPSSELGEALSASNDFSAANNFSAAIDFDEILTQVLEALRDDKLQCDARYCESFVRQRYENGYGPQRIERELIGRGVAGDVVAEMLFSEEYDWAQSAEKTYHKKYSGLEEQLDQRERGKRGRFMQSRGFSIDSFVHLLDG